MKQVIEGRIYNNPITHCGHFDLRKEFSYTSRYHSSDILHPALSNFEGKMVRITIEEI